MHSFKLTLLHIIYTSLNLPCICWQMLKRCIYSRYCIFLFWTLALQLDNDHSLPSFLPYPFQYFNGYIQRNLPQENVRIITVFELSSWSIRNHRPKSKVTQIQQERFSWSLVHIKCSLQIILTHHLNQDSAFSFSELALRELKNGHHLPSPFTSFNFLIFSCFQVHFGSPGRIRIWPEPSGITVTVTLAFQLHISDSW